MLRTRLSDVLPIYQSNLSDSNYLSEGYKKTKYATLNKKWNRPMSKQLIKVPYFISRGTPIDLDFKEKSERV